MTVVQAFARAPWLGYLTGSRELSDPMRDFPIKRNTSRVFRVRKMERADKKAGESPCDR